tara:strand:- start:20 stop:469 length:450 start_codon:yes stop_codon:yes gene_type:complete
MAFRINLIDRPDSRKIHKQPIPVVGGIGIYITLIIVYFFLIESANLNLILTVSGFVVILGLIDDLYNINYTFRFIAQSFFCLIIIFFGDLYIVDLENFFLIDISKIKYFGIIFTIICIVALTNAFNFIDGIDGLAGSQAIIIIIFFLIF